MGKQRGKERAFWWRMGTLDQYQEAASNSVQEDSADAIALEWGFSEEFQALLREDT